METVCLANYIHWFHKQIKAILPLGKLSMPMNTNSGVSKWQLYLWLDPAYQPSLAYVLLMVYSASGLRWVGVVSDFCILAFDIFCFFSSCSAIWKYQQIFG